MLNILLVGVGGQGTVLAAKVLAQAALNKGWQVRSAETIGMAQRGGSVMSHVRMGSNGEEVYAPLVFSDSADVIIAFEPGEALRSLQYLKSSGIIISAKSIVQPVTASLSSKAYRASDVTEALARSLQRLGGDLVLVDADLIMQKLGTSRVLNIVLLASCVISGALPITLDELKQAVTSCVKPQFVDINLRAIDAVLQDYKPL